MGTFKKISCIVFVLLLIFPFSVFAESVELKFGSPYYLFTGYSESSLTTDSSWVYDGHFSGSNNSVEFSEFPSGYRRSFYAGSGSLSKPYLCYGFTGALNDSNGVLDSVHNDWSYSVVTEITFAIQISDDPSKFPQPIPFEDFEFWLTSNHVPSNGSSFSPSGWFPLSVFTEQYNQSFERLSERSTASFYYVTYSISCVFHVPTGINVAGLNFLSLVTKGNNVGSVDPIKFVPYYFQVESIQARYDPAGGEIDDMQSEVDQIVEGQKEAAQYALEQEQQANQEALDGASNQDTSSISDFSSHLFTDGIATLYSSLSYTGTDFNFKFPGSGVIPGIDTELWEEQDIPIKHFIDSVPQPVFIIINALLWLVVMRAAIRLIHKLIDAINGNSYKGSDS